MDTNSYQLVWWDIPENAYIILKNVDKADLLNLRLMNTKISALATDDHLWMKYSCGEYGNKYMNLKPTNLSIFKYYNQMKYIKQMCSWEDAHLMYDNLGLLKYYLDLNKGVIEPYSTIKAWKRGHYTICKWLVEKRIYPIGKHGIFNGIAAAARNGHLKLLKYAHKLPYKHNNLKKFLNVDSADSAASCGHLDILDWFFSIGVTPSKTAFKYAADGGHIHILEWLHKRIIHGRSGSGATAQAVINGDTKTLDWLKAHKLINLKIHHINQIIGECPEYMLDWLETNNFIPTTCSGAASSGRLKNIIWLERYGIYGDQYAADRACISGHVDVLKHFEANGIIPGSVGLEYAVDHRHTNIVTWLHVKGVKPSKRCIRYAKNNGLYHIFETNIETSVLEYARDKISKYSCNDETNYMLNILFL